MLLDPIPAFFARRKEAKMTDDEQAIRDVIQRCTSATNEGDDEAVLDLMWDDALFLVPQAEPFGIEMFEPSEDSAQRPDVHSTCEVLELEVRDDFGWARTHLEVDIVPPEGEPLHKSGYTFTIFKKDDDGEWRLYRDANLVS